MSLSGTPRRRQAGYQENYFSIDDILATQERVPSKFDVPLYNLGFLDPGTDSEHVAEGTKMELPFWVARALGSRKKPTVTPDVPKQYREGYREILNADATVVDLHKMGPYFYMFGTHLLTFDFPESSDIAKTMLQTFQNRFRRIMDSSQNTYNEDTTSLTSKLDETERVVFRAGQIGLNDFQRWETRRVEKLTTSAMVLNHRKRKRAAMETI